MGNCVDYFVTQPSYYDNLNGNIINDDRMEFKEFCVGDNIIYTEYGMKLKGVITKKHKFNIYSIMQKNGVCERFVEQKYLEFDHKTL